MSDTFPAPQGFRPVTDVFERFCEHYGLTLLARAIEKHGSWEWSCCEVSDINRYIILDITEMPAIDGVSPVYDVMVWAVADNAARFTRQAVAEIQLDRGHFSHELLNNVSEMHTNWLSLALASAWERVEELTVANLTDEFILAGAFGSGA